MSKNRPNVTSRDVAKRAGVSQASVSRAFTPGGIISDAKKARILAAADELKYVPNSIASSLITARTNTVALIIGDTGNPFYVHVLRAFISALQKRGQQVLTFTIDTGSTTDDAIRRVLQYRVDAVILTAAQVSTSMLALCQEQAIPIILFNRYIPGESVPVVRCDNAAGGRIMADVLRGAGARSFALLKGDPRGTTSADRAQGFLDRLFESGIKQDAVEQIECGSTYDGARQAVERVYVEQGRALPDAVFGVNDVMAMAAIDVLRFALSKSIPDDIMVAGFDSIPESARAPYQLTTLLQPIDTMVADTLALLDESLAAGDVAAFSAEKIIPSQLIWRKTVPGVEPRLTDTLP